MHPPLPGVPGQPAGRRWQPPPSPLDSGAGEGARIPPVAGWPSFRRIVPISFGAWMAALERWQLTGPGGELRLGHSVLRGPTELIPCRRVQPTAAYLRAGHDLLEALAHALPQPAIAQTQVGSARAGQSTRPRPQLRPDLTGAGVLDSTAPNY